MHNYCQKSYLTQLLESIHNLTKMVTDFNLSEQRHHECLLHSFQSLSATIRHQPPTIPQSDHSTTSSPITVTKIHSPQRPNHIPIVMTKPNLVASSMAEKNTKTPFLPSQPQPIPPQQVISSTIATANHLAVTPPNTHEKSTEHVVAEEKVADKFLTMLCSVHQRSATIVVDTDNIYTGLNQSAQPLPLTPLGTDTSDSPLKLRSSSIFGFDPGGTLLVAYPSDVRRLRPHRRFLSCTLISTSDPPYPSPTREAPTRAPPSAAFPSRTSLVVPSLATTQPTGPASGWPWVPRSSGAEHTPSSPPPSTSPLLTGTSPSRTFPLQWFPPRTPSPPPWLPWVFWSINAEHILRVQLGLGESLKENCRLGLSTVLGFVITWTSLLKGKWAAPHYDLEDKISLKGSVMIQRLAQQKQLAAQMGSQTCKTGTKGTNTSLQFTKIISN